MKIGMWMAEMINEKTLYNRKKKFIRLLALPKSEGGKKQKN